MLATRGVWTKTLVILAIPFLVVALLVAFGAKQRIDRAEAASDDLDGIFPFATVAAMEGSLHEEGALAIGLAAGLIDTDEFSVASAATDAARVELLDELTYHEPESPIGRALASIETGMATIETTRAELLAGSLEGPVSEPYRALLAATTAAKVPAQAVLDPSSIGAAPLTHLDAARSASGEASTSTPRIR